MSINKLSHLKEGEKIYLEVEKVTTRWDDEKSMCFESNSSNSIWVNDDDIFYTIEDLKKLANDGMPKQGELEFGDEVEISLDGEKWYSRDDTTYQFTFISKVKDKYIISKANNVIDKFEKELYTDGIRFYKYCRKHTKKIQKTLAELEKELGYEEGTLEITN